MLTSTQERVQSSTFTSCIEVIGTWTELRGTNTQQTYLVVNMINGLPYNMLTTNSITPFGISYKGKDYYVDAIELVKYQVAWSNDMSVRPIDIEWDEF